ncbi:MAG: hypothetical protein AB7N80_05560 [Bdellovibrionales bacterium]
MSMQVWVRIQLLTLVLTLLATNALATTPDKTEAPLSKPGHVTPPPPAPGDGRELDEYNLLSTPPALPLPPEARETHYYPFRQALSPRLGAVITNDEDHQFEYLLGISYLWPRYRQPQAELGVDLLSGLGGHLNFGVRHIFFERNYFRPYFLWGLTHEVVPEDRLATITNIDNYYLRIAVGMEDTLELPKSVRLELEGQLGIDKYLLLLCLGYTWGF